MIQFESGEWESYETLCERDSRAQHGAIVKYLYISVFIWFIVYMCSLNILNTCILVVGMTEWERVLLRNDSEREILFSPTAYIIDKSHNDHVAR